MYDNDSAHCACEHCVFWAVIDRNWSASAQEALYRIGEWSA